MKEKREIVSDEKWYKNIYDSNVEGTENAY